MAYFGQSTLQPFSATEGLRDYQHASKTFKTAGYDLAPRNKFLFYVYFNLNTNIPAVANLISGGKSSVIGLMVKTAQLPSYQIDVGTMNQYNRKRLVQTKINYNPCQIVFNDDHSDLIRNMWYQYYQYYYSDPTYAYNGVPAQAGTLGQIDSAFSGFTYTANDTYAPARVVEQWGLSGQGYSNPSLQSLSSSLLTGPASSVEPFFRDITIYGMAQKSYAQYTMINPLITDWMHDTYDYSQGNGIVTHTMTIKYENVKYYSGAIGGDQPSDAVPGFADPAHYDTNLSPIANPGSNNTVMTQGSIRPSTTGDTQDLQALATGQNTLQNVAGAVGQGLAYSAASYLYSNSGSLAQQIGTNLGIAGFGAQPATQQSISGSQQGGVNIPWGGTLNSTASPVTASYNPDGTVNALDPNAYGEG